jgi:2-polyprenyl-6-methoxyphenol hydroxylase-like FAD-dependent oxidoreductase
VAVEEGADRVRVTLADGSHLDADLLVGADGIHSAVRRLVFGPERRYLRPLGFHTAAWTFVDPQVHAELRGRFCLTDTIDRQVGLYGLPGDRVAAFTVHRTADPSLPVDPRSAVRERYRDLGWVVPRVLDRCPPGPQVYYDQVAQIVVPPLVEPPGDAARRRRVRGVAAGRQGASMAVAGAYVLADRLDRVGPVGGVGAALAGYEALWRPVVTDVQRTARRGTRWFLPGSRTDLRIRRAALRLAGLPGVDRVVVGAVAGPSSGLVRELAGASGRGRPRPGHRAGSTRCPPQRGPRREVGWRRTSSTWCG